jgi:gamma-glutamyltranspeptidase/glutathione hydrolase
MPSVRADKWMVATSQPLAVDAALGVLEEGGNAFDAAVVAAAVHVVVDPNSTGLGGDAFAMYWSPATGGPVGLAAAGPAPAGLTVEALRGAGFDSMPGTGPWTVTVPGVVAGWERGLERFGTISLARALEPAIEIAEQGFEVTPHIADVWNDGLGLLARDHYLASVYLIDGRAPKAGERVTNPDLATSLRAIARDGARAFYEGRIAQRIEAAVAAGGGPLRASDLARWSGPRWVAPISAAYRGVVVYEMPPPNQGVLALQALKLYAGIECETRADEEHAAIECVKLAFADAERHLADPEFCSVPVEGMLSDAYIDLRRAEFDPAAAALAHPGSPSDTVYIAVMKEGEGCSFIQSIFAGFGSGVGVEGTGIVLQNRGAGFVLEDDHPNRPEPGKRPFHTIIPAMLSRDGSLWGCLGVVGGYLQAQAHLQVLRNLVDRGVDPQAALSEPRFKFLGGRRVAFEPGFDEDVVGALEARGHETSTNLGSYEAGGGQLIVGSGDGLIGGSDPRKDGLAKGA